MSVIVSSTNKLMEATNVTSLDNCPNSASKSCATRPTTSLDSLVPIGSSPDLKDHQRSAKDDCQPEDQVALSSSDNSSVPQVLVSPADEKCAVNSATKTFNLSSKEGQEHLRELNEELKALNQDGNPMLSLIHSASVDAVSVMRRKHSGHRPAVKRKRLKGPLPVDSARLMYRLPGEDGAPSRCYKTVVPRTVTTKKIQASSTSKSNDNDHASSFDDLIDIDGLLEEKACKTNLSAVNVKNLLRYVITNEHVLSMIHNSMEADGVSESTFEPKLTRSKAKEMMEKQAQVPWPISPIKMPSPSRSKKLIEFEFSDSDGSSDEEYKPDKECESDDDESFLSSCTCETVSPSHVNQVTSPSFSSGITSPHLKFGDTISKEISVEAIDLSASTNEAEKFEAESQLGHEQQPEDTIALRTRSKLPLNDTPLEFIESNFIAPDITTDMYDSECDDEDWGNFLGEFLKPLEPDPNEANDDETNDPEYNFLEEEDVPDREDLRDDRAVKITKKEVHELMVELLEVAQEELNQAEEISDKGVSSKESTVKISARKETKLHSDPLEPLFDENRRKQLDEQMRKHVQLLTQVFLLSADMEIEIPEKQLCQSLLVELLVFGKKSNDVYGGSSSFMAHNLESAVDIVSRFGKSAVEILPEIKKKLGSAAIPRRTISIEVMKIIIASEVFMYPNLLPIAGIRSPGRSQQNFLRPEDNLLALGLGQFKELENKDQLSCCELIRDNMLPTKTIKQISIRIKNLKNKKAPDNAVKYYFQNKQPPQMTATVLPFDPRNVKPPRLQSPSILPEWIRTFIRRAKYRPLKPHPMAQNENLPNETKFEMANVAVEILKICDITEVKATAMGILEIGHNAELDETTKALCLPDTQLQDSTTPLLSETKLKVASLNTKTLETLIEGTSAPPSAANEKLVPKQIDLETQEKTHSSATKKSIVGSLTQATIQRPSPLKTVFPILKKYSPICLRKTGGNLKKSLRILLPKIALVPHSCGPRKLVPKVPVAGTRKTLPKKPSVTCLVQNDSDAEVEINNSDSPRPTVMHAELSETADIAPLVESDHESEIEMFDEDAVDTADDEGIDMHADNEDDLAALMAASTTINMTPKHRHSIIRKRKNSMQERDELLALLAPDLLENDPLKKEKATIFAHTYLQKTMDVIGKDTNLFDDFLRLLNDFNHSEGDVVQLYKDVCLLLKDFPQLCEDFLVFLLPEQAMECGKFIEYLSLTKMQLFLRKLEVHFGKHPLHVQEILKLLQHLQQQKNLTITQLKDTMLPLLQGQTHLVEEFLQLFPEESPPERQMVDFEEIMLPDDNEVTVVDDGYEVVKLPETEDVYGTKDCPCECHISLDKLNEQNRLAHCLCCGIKFIDGRIFLHTGKVLKPCQVIYHNNKSQKELVNDEAKECQIIENPNLGGNLAQIMTPTSSVSSLSPPISKDSDEEKDATLKSSLEEKGSSDMPPPNPFLEALEQISDGRISCSSQVETAGEDAILTSGASHHMPSSSAPPNDFSVLRDVIHQSKDVFKVTSEKQNFNLAEETATSKSVQEEMVVKIPDFTAVVSSSQLENKVDEDDNPKPHISWTRESDRTLLQTCQQLSPKKETFAEIAAKLQNKTPEEVKMRFETLMKLFTHNTDHVEKNVTESHK